MADLGSPAAYRPEHADLTRRFCRLGATNDELAECFEVGRAAIDVWLKTEPDFAASVRRGRAVADAAVAERLFDWLRDHRGNRRGKDVPAEAAEPARSVANARNVGNSVHSNFKPLK